MTEHTPAKRVIDLYIDQWAAANAWKAMYSQAVDKPKVILDFEGFRQQYLRRANVLMQQGFPESTAEPSVLAVLELLAKS